MRNGKFTETEEFILQEFYEGKSVTALVRDYLQMYDVDRKTAEETIYKCLYEGALVF